MTPVPIPCSRNGRGMEPDDLLCSRNARPQKDGKGSLAVLLLAERARSECEGAVWSIPRARSMRAVRDRSRPPLEERYEQALRDHLYSSTRAFEDQPGTILFKFLKTIRGGICLSYPGQRRPGSLEKLECQHFFAPFTFKEYCLKLPSHSHSLFSIKKKVVR
jgi:hypothetical protein